MPRPKRAWNAPFNRRPAHSDCWAMLSIMLADEYGHGFGAAPRDARRARSEPPDEPSTPIRPITARIRRSRGRCSSARICRRPGRPAIGRWRSIRWTRVTAVYVGQTSLLRRLGSGCALIARAIELNPHHPGWYWYASFLNAYRHLDYRGALAMALKMNLPGVSLVDVALAATYGQLGDGGAARHALRELLRLNRTTPRLPSGAWEVVRRRNSSST